MPTDQDAVIEEPKADVWPELAAHRTNRPTP